MRKFILTLSLVILAASLTFAQSIGLSINQNAINNGDEVTIYGDSATSTTIYAHIDVTNNTGSDLDIKVKKVEMSLVSGSQNFFCWGQCYTPATYVSPSPVNVAAGATTGGFDGEYMPKGNLGTSKIMYVFFVDGDQNDSTAVIVNFMATPVGVEKNSMKPELSDAFPNPANEKVSFKYELPSDVTDARIIIRNMIGAVVKEVRLSQQTGEATIDTYELNEGVYFYSYILNDKIYVTRKLVIQHR